MNAFCNNPAERNLANAELTARGGSVAIPLFTTSNSRFKTTNCLSKAQIHATTSPTDILEK